MKKVLFLTITVLLLACNQSKKTETAKLEKPVTQKVDYDTEVRKALREHLDAVTAKDIERVKPTLPAADQPMYLFLPEGNSMSTAGEFIKMHGDWFKDTKTEWTLIFEIKYVHAVENMGFAIVEATYNEPNRNNKPYQSIMHVSYVLEKIDGKWLVVKDHASFKEKTE